MKYVNLHIFFFMVHLCNIQMSAAATKHRLEGMDYDIDGFVSQLLASRRFVELVDKLSEEAANRIKYDYSKNTFIVSSDIHEAPVYKEKDTKRRSLDKTYDIDGFINEVLASKNIHDLLAKLTVNAASKIMRFNVNSGLRTRTESSNENLPKTNQVNKAKIRERLTGKIDIQAIINEMLSLSENLKLKYDDDESDTNTKVESKEEMIRSVNNDLMSKKVGSNSKYKVKTETNKNDSKKKKTINLNKQSRDDANGHYGKADPNSESSHGGDSDTGGEDQDNSIKTYNSLEGQGSGLHQEHINSREAQNSKLKVKDIAKQKTSRIDKSIREKENLITSDEENYNPPSKERTNQEVEKTKEETENRSTDENIIINVSKEDSVQNNTVVSDDSGDLSPEQPQERSLENQSSKEQSDEGQVKPIIRKEGGKLYTNVKDSDYDEYNEKMAKWQKTHPENATGFIM